MKIGILGGSFDPPHIEHMYVSIQVQEQLYLDHVVLMPCGRHPFIKELTPAVHRVSMLKLLENTTLKVSQMEVQKEQYSYTIDTLRELTKNSADEYYWIIGSDQLSSFHKWKEWETLIKDYNIVIVPRGLSSHELDETVKETLHLKTIPSNITVLNPHGMFVSNLSSTFIRRRVQLHKSITLLVPQKVEEYIIKNKLYEKK